MADKVEQAQQFEDAITIIVTCRSVVKYNSALSKEQKKELIADIDRTLQFMRAQSHALISSQARLPNASQQETSSHRSEPRTDADQQKLQDLYRMYHTYMSEQQNSLGSFLTRFNEAMAALKELQEIIRHCDGSYISDEQPAERVSSFIADLYYIFVEFISVISRILESNDVHVDTEEIVAAQGGRHNKPPETVLNLAPLISIFEIHQRLNARKGLISDRVNDTLAFLEFLEESLASNFSKRDEIVVQLNSITVLLSDLSQILVSYELAVSTLLGSS